jgi:outer membrane protein OmpA-like peptidoglycan-associated protein
MLSPLSTVIMCALGCCLGSACSPMRRAPSTALDVLPATEYIVRAFHEYPLVALSEMHGNRESKTLFTSVIRDPEFQSLVSDIVVEFGNGRYQDVVDRYLAGGPVPRQELSRVWRDTTQVSGIFTLPMYEELLSAVRSVNLTVAPERRLRVWLGDPPIDWDAVTSPADEDMNDWRDAFFARIVEDRIRKNGRRALLFIGGAHISRTVMFPNSLIHLLDARRPGETVVVSVLDMGRVTPQVAARLRQWPEGAAASVRGSWLGGLGAKDAGFRFSRGTLEQDIDAVALLSHTPLTYVPPPPIDASSPYGAELERRRRLAVATGPFRGGEIRFAADQATLLPEAEKPLEGVFGELWRDPGLELLVKAFSDGRERGAEVLSARRAAVVVRWLVDRGIDARRLRPLGCGSVRPLTFGESDEDRGRNRRAELVRRISSAGCEPPW